MLLPVRILSINYIISNLILLGLLINTDAKVLQDNHITIFTANYGYLTFDFKNNTVVDARCRPCGGCECQITLGKFYSDQNYQDVRCNVFLDGNSERTDYRFRLNHLDDNHVILMGTKVASNDPVGYKLFFITINMSNCKSVRSKLEFEFNRKPSGSMFMPTVESYPIISYNDTFDIFFVNKSLCGNMLCRQIYDKDGNVIEGPVSSYIPDYLYSRMTFSVDPKSSSMGHFVVHDKKFYLIKAINGKIENLMGLPDYHYDMKTFSSNHGLFGICYKVVDYEKVGSTINCTQFNDNGVKILDTSVKIDHKPGIRAASYNLNNGTILLLTVKIEDDSNSRLELTPASYHLQKITTNHVENIYSFKDFDCSYRNFQTNFVVKKNESICMTLTCSGERGIDEWHTDKSIKFKYTCISYS